MDSTRQLVIVGHRGARALSLTENSRDSFAWAIDHHVHEIETDSRLTRDGVIVQLHNKSYVDARGVQHSVAERTYAQIKRDLPHVLTLAELIEFVDQRARLMLEIKPGVPTEPIIATIGRYLKLGWSPDKFSFASFDHHVLHEFHQALPQIDRIVLESWFGLRALRRAKQLNTPYVSMNQQYLWWGFIRWASWRRHRIYSYPHPTGRLPFNHDKPRRWTKHGLYGIITDRPENF
jgi:glycerophosphoryl diester phosphodiesterase